MSTKRLLKIGENLRIYREASGRAIDVVANSLGVDVGFLRSVEHGRKELDFVQYVGVAEMYSIGFSSIFENEADKYFHVPRIPASIIEFIVQRGEEYCKEKRISKNQLFERLGTNRISFSHFKSGYSMPTPQRVENMIALFGLTHVVLKGVMHEVKVPEKKQIVNPAADIPLGWRDPEMVKEQDIQEDFNHVKNAVIIDQYNKKPDERNATMDALTVVTDALAFYKKRNEVVAELERIIKVAQALIEEMKA